MSPISSETTVELDYHKTCDLCNMFPSIYNALGDICHHLYIIPKNKGSRLKFYIKYMVSNRCKMAVKEELKKLGLHFIVVDLGEVEIMETMSAEQQTQLKTALLASGLELMDDKRSILIEKIKNVITEMIHYTDEIPKVNYSDYISEKLNYDYTYLSNLFSEVKGITIQQFIIIHKIEKVKELLFYDELNLTEISYKLHYSSVAHLSNQFKKITGLSPSHYKQMKNKRRSPIEEIGDSALKDEAVQSL